MFIGHFGAALAAKRAAPQTSLGTLIFASTFIDLLWPILLVLGLEQVKISPGITTVTPLDFVSYPISHSLVAVMLWGILFGAAYYAFRGYRTGALILGLLVISHWFLDLIVHRPDLPLTPGNSLKMGLGLWDSLLLTLLVEIGIFVIGLILYLGISKARNKTGILALGGLIGFIAIVYIANLAGPPPPNETVIGWAGLAAWLFVLWGFWIDRNRGIAKTKDSS